MRPYKPWYRKATNTWYVEVGGKQNPLGKHPAELPPPKKGKNGWVPPQEIITAFHKLMAGDPTHLPKPAEILVCQDFNTYSQEPDLGGDSPDDDYDYSQEPDLGGDSPDDEDDHDPDDGPDLD